MFLNFQISINDIYDHIRMPQNKDISSELTKYFNTCVENNEYGKKTKTKVIRKVYKIYPCKIQWCHKYHKSFTVLSKWKSKCIYKR